MQVNATNATTQQSSAPTTAAASAARLNYDSFLKLLVAQMKNQDPTAPNDPTQQLAQLASFSNVEQAIQTNAKLDALLTSSALSQAEGLIGRTITSADGIISGKVVSLTIASGGAVAILDDGKQVALGTGVKVS